MTTTDRCPAGAAHLAGRKVLVTGASSGLGRAIAIAFAQAGADLVLTGRKAAGLEITAAEATRAGIVTHCLTADLSRIEAVELMVDAAIARAGRIDVLVNNAGIPGPDKPFLSVEPGEWEHVIATNLTGPAFCARAVASHMVERGGGGRIINIASIGGLVAISRLAPYGASKAGLIHLTKVMALELARHDIQVNVICPGWFISPMNENFFRTDASSRMVERSIPMRRIGDAAREIAPMAVYLASAAAGFMTGSVVVIDGGQAVV